MEYPMMSVLDAMQRGVQMGRAIRQKRLEEARLEQMQQQAQMEDLRNQMLLESVSRPVTAGMVTVAGPEGPDVGGFRAPGITVHRKPDSSRTVKYRTRTGETIMRELLTPEEQAERELAQRVLAERVLRSIGIEGKLAETQALEDLRQRIGVELPNIPGVRMFGSEVPRVAPSIISAQSRSEEGEKTRKFKEEQAEIERKAREERQRKEHAFRAAEGEKSRRNARTVAAIRPNAARDRLTRDQQVDAALGEALREFQASGGNVNDPEAFRAFVNSNAERFNWEPGVLGGLNLKIGRLKTGSSQGEKSLKEIAAGLTGKTGGGGAAPKAATAADVSAYAKAKGISEAQARKEFEASGFTVK